jgi:hypothetical protein
LGRRSRRRERAPQASQPAPAPRRRPSSAERDARIRERLRPLEEGERPRAVTVAAIAALALALGNLAVYLTGARLPSGERPPLTGMLVYEALLLTAAYGLWRARYWAVLGFEFILGLLIVYVAIYLVGATEVLGVVVAVAIGAPAAVLFWFLVRAMARIQMPRPPGSR